jgi:hypothetical protein
MLESSSLIKECMFCYFILIVSTAMGRSAQPLHTFLTHSPS